jgi:predicted nucleic acid-binding protein
MRTVLLDSEAVQALLDPAHPKHRLVLAHLAGVVSRRRKGLDVTTVVPTAVRVESRWDRSTARAAGINRLRIADRTLDTQSSDVAAAIARRTGTSVADSHIGAVAVTADPGDVVVLTSDPDDMVRVSTPRPIVAIRV